MKMVQEICKHCKHYLLCMCGDEFKDCKLRSDERALDFGKMLKNHGESEDSYTSGAAGYKIGATEQRKIDIDKACEWLKSQADECFVSGDSVGEHLVFKDLNLAEFLKATEE